MNIKKYKLYLIGLDGTIHNGEVGIKYAKWICRLSKYK